MSQQDGSLGDITRVMNDTPIQDLSWMQLTPGENYDNIPSDFNHQAIPQLESQWSNEHFENPFYLVPSKANVVMNDENPRSISPEQIVEVVQVAKQAMMNGSSGKEVASELRDRYASEVIQAAAPELRKVASEEGLLGNVYVDLSAYNSTKEALQRLGHHKIRTASFAVGSPRKERDYVDSFGRCRNLAKTVVASVDYTPAVLSHYENHLKNIGALSHTASITSREDLRLAFLSIKNAQEAAPCDQPKSAPVSDETVVTAMNDLAEQNLSDNDKASADLRLSQARPVLAKIHDLMLKGFTGNTLKQNIRACCASEELNKYSSEISKLAGLQGLIGPVFADLSVYSDAKTACETISRAPMRPKFLISTLPTKMGFSDKVATTLGIPVFTRDSIFPTKTAGEVIMTLESAGKLSSKLAFDYMERLKSGHNNVLSILRSATQEADTPAQVMAPAVADASESATQPMFLSSGDAETKAPIDRASVRTASMQAMQRGLSLTAVQGKVASMMPVGEAIGIVREAVASLEIVSADVLDKCQSERYTLNKNAKLASALKCAECVSHVGPACTQQGRAFEGETMLAPSMSAPSVDPHDGMNLQDGSTMVIDLSNVITPPKNLPPMMGSRPTMGIL